MRITRGMRQSLLIAAILALAACSSSKSVDTGATWTVSETTKLGSLTIAPGAQIQAPSGKSLSLVVDGAETDLAPGSYKGDIVLSVTDASPVDFAGMMGAGATVYQFRQALFVDDKGVVEGKSVTAAAGKYAYQNGVLSGAQIKSTGEDFNGIVVTGGTQTIKNADIDFTGNGGNDFVGYGAAILSTGPGTTLIVDGSKIVTRGVVRTGAIADKGSDLIVENSQIETHEGTLPASYIPNVTPGKMLNVPWMLGLAGDVRATNLLGEGTRATYINSSISSDQWGVLSVDNGSNTRLTTINSKVSNTGGAGYGSYAIGNSINTFLGTSFDVGDYAQIITGGNAIFAASTPEAVAKINADNKIGLTDDQIKALATQQSTVKSARFGVMWHGDGAVTIKDGTTFTSAETSFLDKGAIAQINVDGAGGASVTAGNGVLVQVMDDDDPGPVNADGLMANTGVYHEPTEPPKKAKDFDVAKVNPSDVTANFSNITLQGSVYNSTRGKGGNPVAAGLPTLTAGGAPGGAGGPPGAGGGAPGGAARPPAAGGKNIVVNLDGATLSGVISSSTAKHAKDTITAADYKLLGELTNTVGPAVNNGVLLTLKKSTWTVTGKSYLTALTLDADSKIVAASGSKVSLTVNGAAQPIKAGNYKGQIVLQVATE
jgi:hypothetical protein